MPYYLLVIEWLARAPQRVRVGKILISEAEGLRRGVWDDRPWRVDTSGVVGKPPRLHPHLARLSGDCSITCVQRRAETHRVAQREHAPLYPGMHLIPTRVARAYANAYPTA